MKLSETEERFILHWGEMGARWGINRTVAQIHALLYLSQTPLNAEEIVETLSVARSNVSNSLKELQGWGIVRVVHVMGDRRDHFESLKDVWDMFEVIIEERKRREIDPTIALLRELKRNKKPANKREAHVDDRIRAMLSFMEQMTGWYSRVKTLPRASLKAVFTAGNLVRAKAKAGE